jgi:hypothetical protein
MILNMDYKESTMILKSAYDKIFDERIWQRWLVDIQGMDEKNYLNFYDYKEKLLNSAKYKNRSKEDRKIDYEHARKMAEIALKKCNPKNDLGKIPEKKKV